MAKRILGITASVLLLVFLSLNVYTLIYNLEMQGSYIAPTESDRVGYIMKFSFERMFSASYAWLEILAIIAFVAVAVIAVINIFRKKTVFTLIMLGTSVFASVLYMLFREVSTFAVTYSSVMWRICPPSTSYCGVETTAFECRLAFFYSFIVIAVLLAIDYALAYFEKQKQAE